MATSKTNIVMVNGKEINSIKDLPPEILDLIDKNRDGKMDGFMDLIKNASQLKPTATAFNIETPTMTMDQIKQLAITGSANPEPTSPELSWLLPIRQIMQTLVWVLVAALLLKQLFPEVWTQLLSSLPSLPL